MKAFLCGLWTPVLFRFLSALREYSSCIFFFPVNVSLKTANVYRGLGVIHISLPKNLEHLAWTEKWNFTDLRNKQTRVLHSWKHNYCCQIWDGAPGIPQAPGVKQSRQDADKSTGSQLKLCSQHQLFLFTPDTEIDIICIYFCVAAFPVKPAKLMVCQNILEQRPLVPLIRLNCPFTESVHVCRPIRYFKSQTQQYRTISTHFHLLNT